MRRQPLFRVRSGEEAVASSSGLMGGCREIIGSGTLFANASLLLGEHFHFMEITVIPDYRGILLVILPPGGFLFLGLLLCLQRKLQALLARKSVEGGESCASA